MGKYGNPKSHATISLAFGRPVTADWISKVASLAIVAGGIVLVFVHYYAGSPDDPDGWLSAVGFAAPFIGAGLVALTGTIRSHAGLMLAAGVAILPMSLLSIVLIPLLIPAAVLIVQATNKGVRLSSLLIPAAIAAGLIGALAVIVFHQDPTQWTTPEGSGGSSNIVTTTEAVFGIAIAVAAVAVAVWIPADPQRRPEPHADS